MTDQQNKKRMSCGLDYPLCSNISHCLKEGLNNGYHFIVCPVIHPRYRRELIKENYLDRNEPLSRSDLVLTGQDWNRLIVGKISPHLDPDCEIQNVREVAEAALLQELDFSNHLCLPVIMLRIHSSRNTNLGRILNSKLLGNCSYQVWIHIPLVYQPHSQYLSEQNEREDTWEWWNQLRSVCHYDRRLGITLELTEELPSEEELDRWIGEPVRCILIPTKLFLTNQHNYAVLSQAHQHIIEKFFNLDVQYIITGKCRHFSIANYYQYIDFLGKKFYKKDAFTDFAQGCEDYLQNPLQPLTENLENSVYEVFEKDPIKYNQYQHAIQKALEDRPLDVEVVIMVVGAGRGPLIRAALNASELSGRNIRVYALEKNPHAINTLRSLISALWKDKVEVFAGDMRNFTPKVKADIIVSELLGSFGDNELSPECLDGAQRFLKEDGISIPTSYTSWLAPLQGLKIYNEIRYTRPADKTLLSVLETPYVVHLVNQYSVDTAKPLFKFVHPNKDKPINNYRYKILRFKSKLNCVLTGFVGYFESDLYRGVTISTVPCSFSKGMMSWFPIVFPLQEAIQIKANDEIEIAFWRCSSNHKVWYEWCLTKPVSGPVCNPNGRSYSISQ